MDSQKEDTVDLVDNEEPPAQDHVTERDLHEDESQDSVPHPSIPAKDFNDNTTKDNSTPIRDNKSTGNGHIGSSNGHAHKTSDDEKPVIGVAGVYPVLYETQGSTRVVQQSQRTAEEGTVTITTPNVADTPAEERPMRAKDLKYLKIFSIVGTILFPPTGIAALFFAFQTEIEFWKGCDQGDLTIAKKKCKICERLIIFSVVFGLIMYVMVLAIVEKNLMMSDSGYAERRLGLLHVGSVTG